MAILITRDDSRFNNLKRARNGRWPANPADGIGSVALCLGADDTAEALQRVVNAGQRPTIRSGGHCYEDFYANNSQFGQATNTAPARVGQISGKFIF